MHPFLAVLVWFLGCCAAGLAVEQQPAATPPPVASIPVYRLAPGDQIRLVVFDEPDLLIEQTLDERGEVRLALHGPLLLAGLTAREAERRIEAAYQEARLLRQPQAAVTITGYRVRAALAVGQFRGAGAVAFPPGRETVTLVEFVALAGGFTELARTGTVRVSRTAADGAEQSFSLDYGAMLEARRSGGKVESFDVLPGDKVFADTRIF